MPQTSHLLINQPTKQTKRDKQPTNHKTIKPTKDGALSEVSLHREQKEEKEFVALANFGHHLLKSLHNIYCGHTTSAVKEMHQQEIVHGRLSSKLVIVS